MDNKVRFWKKQAMEKWLMTAWRTYHASRHVDRPEWERKFCLKLVNKVDKLLRR